MLLNYGRRVQHRNIRVLYTARERRGRREIKWPLRRHFLVLVVEVTLCLRDKVTAKGFDVYPTDDM